MFQTTNQMLVYLNVSTCVLMSFVFCYPGFSIRSNDLISVEVYSGWWFFALPLWQMMEFVNGKDDYPYMKWKNKTCSKPPTSIIYIYIHNIYIYIYTYDPCMYIRITCNICPCMRICMCMCQYVSMYMYAYVYMYTTIYIYIYICIYIYMCVLCYICNVPIPKLWQHSPRRLHPTP